MISAFVLTTMLSIEEPKIVVEKPKIEARKRGKRSKRNRGNGLR
jgi:hypothetical protein